MKVETEWDKNRDGAIVRAIEGPRRIEVRVSCEKGKAPRLDVQQLGARDVLTFDVSQWEDLDSAIRDVLFGLNVRCSCGRRFGVHADGNGCAEGFRAETASQVWR